MSITITNVHLYRTDVRTRMPFRYGIATMTEVPHLFVEVSLKNSSIRGISADHLPPKWFTKDPEKPVGEEIDEMLAVIRHAAARAHGLSGETFFDLWRELYSMQETWARETDFPPLLAHFGTSLIERALLDALCRQAGTPLREMIQRDRLGLRLNELDPALCEHAEQDALPHAPPERIILRHTVGLGDPLADDEIASADRLNDGLPQALPAVISATGVRHFKIKVQATPEAPERLNAILACIEKHASDTWEFSLDANESFQTPGEFRAYWQEVSNIEIVRRNLSRLLFVEQPLHRAVALDERAGWHNWPERPPIIIDESDGNLEAGRNALALGYDGISHKNCKGVVKGILNRCRVAATRHEKAERPRLMSGEDLANIGPVALPQDLAVQTLLGNNSIERNGHHYFRGLAMFPEQLQRAVVEAHPDLYTWHSDGFAHLRVEDGCLSTQSVLTAPFGYAFDFDPSVTAESL